MRNVLAHVGKRGLSAEQSDPIQPLFDGVSADGGAAPIRSKGDGAGTGGRRGDLDDSAEAAEDRGSDPSDGAEGLAVDGGRLPVCRTGGAHFGATSADPLAVLNGEIFLMVCDEYPQAEVCFFPPASPCHSVGTTWLEEAMVACAGHLTLRRHRTHENPDED